MLLLLYKICQASANIKCYIYKHQRIGSVPFQVTMADFHLSSKNKLHNTHNSISTELKNRCNNISRHYASSSNKTSCTTLINSISSLQKNLCNNKYFTTLCKLVIFLLCTDATLQGRNKCIIGRLTILHLACVNRIICICASFSL